MSEVDVTTVQIAGADGTTLEGDLLTPAEPTGTAVVCHPHPLYGGSRRDAVVSALSRGLVAAGRQVLRFDFRGAGGSAGTHGGGPAERDDLLAAVASLDTGLPLILAGYSFGADVALSVTVDNAEGWLAVAPPLGVFVPTEMVAGADPRRVRIVVGAHDEVATPRRVELTVADWRATEVVTIGGADHFFAGRGGRLADLAADFAT